MQRKSIIPFSSHTKQGRDEVWEYITEYYNEYYIHEGEEGYQPEMDEEDTVDTEDMVDNKDTEDIVDTEDK